VTRPPLFHDHREAKEAPRDWIGPVLFVVIALAAAILLTRCGAPARSAPPPCPAIAELVLEGRLAEEKAGCGADPEKLCPALVAEYDAKIDAVPDEVCP
jgi:hypothetical protein